MSQKVDFSLKPAFLNAAAIFLEKYKDYPNEVTPSPEINYKIASYSYNDLIKNLSSIGLLQQAKNKFRILEYSENYNLSKKQLIFLKYIEGQLPDWSIGFLEGLDHFKHPDSNDEKLIFQCMDEVGLLSMPLSASANYLNYKIIDLIRSNPSTLNKMKLGREGEEMTMMYEFNKTKTLPLHKSSYNNYAGYDVESYYPDNKIKHIEVKTSEIEEAYISFSEWFVALNTIKRRELYEFHFWKKRGNKWSLAILHPDDLSFMGEVNKNNHHWKDYCVKFQPFEDKFIEIKSNQLKKINDE